MSEADEHDFVVGPQLAGRRLDHCLVEQLPRLSRARLKALIEKNMVTVDESPGKPSQKLKGGQTVRVTVPPVEPPNLAPDPSVGFAILYDDPDMVVVDKPAGLVVHPAAGHPSGTLVHGLLAACSDLAGVGGLARPGIVHRLDKDTSGVMVAAKTDRAHQALVEDFKRRRVEKTYWALCRGAPPSETGRIEAPIGRHPVRRKEMSTRSRAGRPALTLYRLRRRFGGEAAWLELDLKTGRTHQIRVHLAAIGVPVLGDPVYGRGNTGSFSGGRFRDLLTRQMLHARRLGFNHPVTGRPMTFDAPMPTDMARLLDALEAWESGAARDGH